MESGSWVLSDAVAGYAVIETVAMACVGGEIGLGSAEELFELFLLRLLLLPVGMDEV